MYSGKSTSPRVEKESERKMLEILKNHFRQFYKLSDDIPLHTKAGLENYFKLMYHFITMVVETNFFFCIVVFM